MNEPMPSATVIRRRRLQLLLVAAFFFGPLALAFVMYYGGAAWIPHHRVEHGTLIEPPRTLPLVSLPTPSGAPTAADFLRHKWSLIHAVRGTCDDHCLAVLTDLGAVRLALHRDAERVQVVVLADRACCADLSSSVPAHALAVALADGEEAAALRQGLGLDKAGSDAAETIYLVDPNGNFFMTYGSGYTKKGILADLEKLLRLSHIG